ncbi:MAG: hypothetical protein JO186_05170 [Actinobacteria bacterium]|nr:hypothetical protein [Actinomycetota bacterium]
MNARTMILSTSLVVALAVPTSQAAAMNGLRHGGSLGTKSIGVSIAKRHTSTNKASQSKHVGASLPSTQSPAPNVSPSTPDYADDGSFSDSYFDTNPGPTTTNQSPATDSGAVTPSPDLQDGYLASGVASNG